MTTIRRSLEVAARAAVAQRTEALFAQAGALKEGHFLLKSGRHSERYLEKFLLLQDPAVTSELCGFWAAAARGSDGKPLVDVVAGPTTGGIVLAFETARQLGVRGIFAEEVRAGTARPAASSGAGSASRRASASCLSTTSSRRAARCSRCCRRSRRRVARSWGAS